MAAVDSRNDDVHELTIATPTGEVESLRPTGLHKFYRATDAQWVSAKDLSAGDRLQGANGPLFVRATQKLPGTHRVYNLTIEGEHVYRVSNLGVLVHNNGCAQTGSSQVATATNRQLQKKFKHAPDFGVAGTPNKANLARFHQAIQRHLNDSATRQINGTFRGKSAIINVNPNTGLAVIRNPNGGFVSGWRLSSDQLKHVLSSGKLGGG